MVPRQSLISRYELLGRLGAGGMAEVFLARARGIEDFEKIVVLKRIRPDKAGDPHFVAMLRDEARVAAVLEHPAIVHTYDVGVDDTGIFISMEYLHGEDVKSILDRASSAGEVLPIPLALRIVSAAAAGLHYAHERTDSAGTPLRIVHRDVSPANLLVTTHGDVKLIDFGIAKAGSKKEQTAVGVLKGKVAYMSPEQVRAKPLDRRSDVFSLGTLLYELTTMRRPFIAEDHVAVMHQICNEPHTPPSAIRPGYPAPLAAIVDRALAKNPDDRYPTAFEMLEAIERVTRDYGLEVLPGALGRYLEHLFGPKPLPWLGAESTAGAEPSRTRTGPMPWDLSEPGDAARGGEDSMTITAQPRRVRTQVSESEASPPAMTEVTAASSAGTLRGMAIGFASALAVGVVGLWIWQAGTPEPEAATVAASVAKPPAAASADPASPSPAPREIAEPESEPPPAVVVEPADEDEDAASVEPAPDASPEPPPPPPELDADADEDADEDANEEAPPGEGAAGAAHKRADRREAARLLDDVGALILHKKFDEAEQMVKKSLRLHRTGRAYTKLALIECGRGRASAASSAYRKARSRDQDMIKQTCAAKGVKL